MSILVVDDSLFILRFVEHSLKTAGFAEIETLTNGDGVFDFLNDNNNYERIKLILMDVFMKGTNGLLICQMLKNNSKFNNIPVMIMTADPSEKILQESFSAGAVDYITKPIRKTELLARVKSSLKLKQEIEKAKSREQELLEVKDKLEMANYELARLVSLDGLTGIPNRRSFDQTLSAEWHRAYEENTSLGLIMIDIDWFKEFNDTYGHQAGDRCLQRVAVTIRHTLKGSLDFVARYGGEEFAVILPSTSLEATMEIAEKIRSNILNLRIPHDNTIFPEGILTISLGAAAAFPRKAGRNLPTVLVKAADDALYKAKNCGKNLVKYGK